MHDAKSSLVSAACVIWKIHWGSQIEMFCIRFCGLFMLCWDT